MKLYVEIKEYRMGIHYIPVLALCIRPRKSTFTMSTMHGPQALALGPDAAREQWGQRTQGHARYTL